MTPLWTVGEAAILIGFACRANPARGSVHNALRSGKSEPCAALRPHSSAVLAHPRRGCRNAGGAPSSDNLLTSMAWSPWPGWRGIVLSPLSHPTRPAGRTLRTRRAAARDTEPDRECRGRWSWTRQGWTRQGCGAQIGGSRPRLSVSATSRRFRRTGEPAVWSTGVGFPCNGSAARS